MAAAHPNALFDGHANLADFVAQAQGRQSRSFFIVLVGLQRAERHHKPLLCWAYVVRQQLSPKPADGLLYDGNVATEKPHGRFHLILTLEGELASCSTEADKHHRYQPVLASQHRRADPGLGLLKHLPRYIGLQRFSKGSDISRPFGNS